MAGSNHLADIGNHLGWPHEEFNGHRNETLDGWEYMEVLVSNLIIHCSSDPNYSSSTLFI